MKYYIDFDNTLFDSERFYRDLLNIANQVGLTKEMINNCYQEEFRDELFNPFKVIEYLIDRNHLDKEITKKIANLLKQTSRYLYDDAISFLEFLKKGKSSLILLTYGDVSYQKAKIKEAGIREYFEEVMITSRLKGDLGLDYQNSVFVDDDILQITSLLKKGAKVIRVRRCGNKHSLENIDNVFECEDLHKLQWIIKNNNF